jgi:predicted nuclease with TOPRIM domain
MFKRNDLKIDVKTIVEIIEKNGELKAKLEYSESEVRLLRHKLEGCMAKLDELNAENKHILKTAKRLGLDLSKAASGSDMFYERALTALEHVLPSAFSSLDLSMDAFEGTEYLKFLPGSADSDTKREQHGYTMMVARSILYTNEPL